MAGPLAKLYATLGLDARDFQRGLSGAKTNIAGFSATASDRMRVAGAVIGGGLALAARGALEMEERAASFQAQTGASAEEAKHFAESLNAMSGRSLVAMDDIAESMTVIRTDLGLTGAAADIAAGQFERYERATAQGSSAVLAFDDILDAWNLEASSSGAIMDVLVKSHQLYGGSIADSQKLLADLAPALQAANMSWEEGQGLLNLFARAGVSGEAATTAFNRALTKVESPDELRRLLEDISATEDPFERAQKAAELFGARAGTKLAQALSDADGELDRFVVSVGDAAGATEAAAGALDSTITSKFKLALNQAQSMLRGFGMSVGPILTGAFSALSLGQALGMGKIFGPLGSKAAAAFTLAFRGIDMLLGGVFSGLAGKMSTWGASMAASFAGAAGAGGFIGALGAAVAAMAPLAIPAIIAVAGKPIVDQAVNSLPLEQSAKDILTKNPVEVERRSNFRWPWEAGGLFHQGEISYREGLADLITRGTEWAARDAGAGVAAAGGTIAQALYDPLSSISVDAFDRIPNAAADAMKETGLVIKTGFGNIKQALKDVPDLLSRATRVDNMEKRQKAVWRNLHKAVKADDPVNIEYWAGAAVTAQRRLDNMRGKSKTSSADIRKKFKSMGIDIEGTWLDTENSARRHSQGAKDAATTAAQDIASQVTGTLGGIDLFGAGLTVITTWVAGLSAGKSAVQGVANALAAAFAPPIEGHSPPKEGPLKDIDKWGKPLVASWLGGIESQVGRVGAAGSRLAGALSPRPGMGNLAYAVAGGSSGVHNHYHIGTLIADDGGIDQLDRRLGRRRRLRERGSGRYNDPG